MKLSIDNNGCFKDENEEVMQPQEVSARFNQMQELLARVKKELDSGIAIGSGKSHTLMVEFNHSLIRYCQD